MPSLHEQAEIYYDNNGRLQIPAANDSSNNANWPLPQPITARIQPEAYPIDALPDVIRSAVEEVGAFVKAPIALVASSALGSLSLACQAYVDVKRAEKLHGPSGLFFLIVADSGERKSTCDGFFTSPIRQYQADQAEAMKPEIDKYHAQIAAWEAEREGLLSAIKESSKRSKPTDKLRAELIELEHDKLEPPRVPRLLYADTTPEALAYGLAKQWPSAGIMSSEAGVVLGSHGMGRDSIMKNLGMLNQLWDGSSLDIDRRTSESFTVRGARLTICLQIQEATLRAFFDKSGTLARGTGFFARFLVAWPESTQGARPFTEAPANWPKLAEFHKQITAILNTPAPIDEFGALSPTMLGLDSNAKAAWVKYHDSIESELCTSGELHDVRDVASKSADNAARLAALFQWFSNPGSQEIGLHAFENASRIAAWHLHEARRFFGELALPAELANAAKLDGWLIGYCQSERTHLVGKSTSLQYSPLRKKESLEAAIQELVELDRLQVRKDGKRVMLEINPRLFNS